MNPDGYDPEHDTNLHPEDEGMRFADLEGDFGEKIFLDREVLKNDGQAGYLLREFRSGEECMFTTGPDGLETTCDKMGMQCQHVLPALNLGIGRNHINQILDKGEPSLFTLPIYYDHDVLGTVVVTITPMVGKFGKYGEVSVATPIDGIGKHTQSHRSLGTIKHSIGMVGEEDNYLSIKTMVSSWCQSLCNDILAREYKPGTDQYDMCKSNRHQPTRSRTYTKPTIVELSTLCLTGLCPKCFLVVKAATRDVPVPF